MYQCIYLVCVHAVSGVVYEARRLYSFPIPCSGPWRTYMGWVTTSFFLTISDSLSFIISLYVCSPDILSSDLDALGDWK